MDITEFTQNFESQFDDIDAGTLTAETEFKTVEGWSSLVAMFVIAMVDADYDVTISGNEIKGAVTIQDIYNIVASKLPA